jgi:hypothetical protein
MVQHDCGEIPVIDTTEQVVGVTDRDIVCRVVAQGKILSPIRLRSAGLIRDHGPGEIPSAGPGDDGEAPDQGACRRRDDGHAPASPRRGVDRRRHQVAELVREISRDTGQFLLTECHCEHDSVDLVVAVLPVFALSGTSGPRPEPSGRGIESDQDDRHDPCKDKARQVGAG